MIESVIREIPRVCLSECQKVLAAGVHLGQDRGIHNRQKSPKGRFAMARVEEGIFVMKGNGAWRGSGPKWAQLTTWAVSCDKDDESEKGRSKGSLYDH